MEGSLGDRHDETVYYISSNSEELAVQNMVKLQKLTVFFGVVYFLYLILAYIVVQSFSLRLSYFSVPLYILAFWKITDLLRRRPDMKVWMSRAVDIAFFTGLAFIVAYVDGVTYGSSPTVLFPMVLMSVTGFYMDYFWMIAGLEILMTAVFCVTTIMLRGPAAMPEGLCICLAAMTVSLYSFWCILTEFTDRAYDNRVLKDEGSRDLLTGLLNKVSFEREVRNYLNSRKDNGIGVLIIIDFDNFKRVNDNYGHLVGDEILQKFGKILTSNFRVSDIVGRIGGDEFMVLMTGSVPDEIIDKKCSTIEWELQSASVGDARGFSCSMGVAVDRACFRFEELYLFADDALYEAKERGKATFVRRDANPGETPPEHKD